MALQFPASPADGDVYPAAPNSEYIYNADKGAWESLPTEAAKTVTSDNSPANPKDGDQWFNTVDGTLYIYVVDTDGGQWVESQAPITANGYYSPNYIINGGFDIWQRGTSFTVGTSAPYTADRWQVFRQGVAGLTVSRQPGTTGLQFCMRVQRDSGVTTTNTATVWQNLETVNSIPLAGKTITLSFFARAGANYSAASNAFIAQIYSGTGTDQNVNVAGFTNATVIGNVTHTLTTSWQRFIVTATVPTNATQVAVLFSAASSGTAGANDWFELDAVQLEEGAVATTFRRNANSIQGELAACQRYYWRLTPSAVYGRYANGYASTTGGVMTTFYPPVTMRKAPTSLEANIIAYSDTDATASAVTGANLNNAGPSAIGVNFGGTFTQFRPYIILANNSLNSYIAFNAEL